MQYINVVNLSYLIYNPVSCYTLIIKEKDSRKKVACSKDHDINQASKKEFATMFFTAINKIHV